ncbi:hypothetical protein DVH24_014978 [Malus domestica]|uniref:F-box domain-containing protein n=1 Tax=Malus domestica TaxID=3750 RepID=A0A498K0D8_MALDO|nr:hypothetical protein DVH24_014978 [Malus domestica]
MTANIAWLKKFRLRQRRKNTKLTDLPFDILVNILKRLPVKSLSMCHWQQHLFNLVVAVSFRQKDNMWLLPFLDCFVLLLQSIFSLFLCLPFLLQLMPIYRHIIRALELYVGGDRGHVFIHFLLTSFTDSTFFCCRKWGAPVLHATSPFFHPICTGSFFFFICYIFLLFNTWISQQFVFCNLFCFKVENCENPYCILFDPFKGEVIPLSVGDVQVPEEHCIYDKYGMGFDDLTSTHKVIRVSADI